MNLAAEESRAAPTNHPPLLEMRMISKYFPGVKALDDVRLHVHAGEVLAIVGENGAGKSTLMKILAGVQQPNSGELLIDGQPTHFPNVEASLNAGIALIHQELNLADNLSVAENLFLGREPHWFGWVNRQQEFASASKYLKQVGLDVAPHTPVHELPIGQQQLVEIAKALSIQARVLIMDEPTSSLSQAEADNLLQVIQTLSAQGVSILYISHRLREIEEIADRVTVLRDGKNAGDLLSGNISHQTMVPLMVGRDVSRFYERHPHPPGDEVLRIENVKTTQYPGQAICFSVRKGEIVGLAGLIGAGRSELLRALIGVDVPLDGNVWLNGKQLATGDPRAAIQAGLALVPEDRKQQGLILEMSVEQNASLAALASHARMGGLIDRRYEKELGKSSVEKLRIRTPSAAQLVGLLSGGNQQKVVIAKWLAMNPLVLLLDEPTRGIDIGAKAEIYQLIDQLASRGVAILFASSELEEIIGMSDRVLVMREGRLTGELSRTELSEEAIMQLATTEEVTV